jgi:hypothetical protein
LPEAETRAKPLAPAGGASDDCGARPEKYTTSPSPPTSLVDQLMPRHEPRMTQQSQDQFPRKHDCVQCARDTLSQRPKNRRCPGPPAAGTPTPRSKEACLSRLRRRGQRNGTFEGSSPSRLPTEADSSPWQGRPPVLLPSLRKNRRGQRPAQMRGWCVQAQDSLRALQLTSGAEHTQPHDFMRHPTDACARLPVQSKREHLSILAVCIQRGVHWAIVSALHTHR